MSSDREALKSEFLDRHGFGRARRAALSGDASTRRYERLHMPDGAPLIFMDQPPALESSVSPPDATREQRFVHETQRKYPLHTYHRLARLMHELRVVKQPEELKLLREACRITRELNATLEASRARTKARIEA